MRLAACTAARKLSRDPHASEVSSVRGTAVPRVLGQPAISHCLAARDMPCGRAAMRLRDGTSRSCHVGTWEVSALLPTAGVTIGTLRLFAVSGSLEVPCTRMRCDESRTLSGFGHRTCVAMSPLVSECRDPRDDDVGGTSRTRKHPAEEVKWLLRQPLPECGRHFRRDIAAASDEGC